MSVALGEAQIEETLTEAQLDTLRTRLRQIGFELIEDREEQAIQQIKSAVIAYVRADKQPAEGLAEYLSRTAESDYASLNRMFAAREGRTVEKFFLLQRIEYVKELIEYGELTIKEIAYRTGFSSVAHLSRQFKQLTGLTPSAYKQCQSAPRRPIDGI